MVGCSQDKTLHRNALNMMLPFYWDATEVITNQPEKGALNCIVNERNDSADSPDFSPAPHGGKAQIYQTTGEK